MAVCTRCYQPYGGLLSHAYTDEEVSPAYLKFGANCTSRAVYYKNCAYCGAIGTATFEYGEALGHIGGTATCFTRAQCVRCYQPYGALLAHVYTNDIAAPAYLKSVATCTSKAVYYKSCAFCGAAGTMTFEYGNVEEHSYHAEWSKDAEKHWHECSVCAERKDETFHSHDAGATEEMDKICTVCAYIIQKVPEHTHNYSIIKNDEMNHWHECACGSRSNEAAHIWDGGVVTKDATYDEAGEKTYTCSVCSCMKRESIEKLGPPEQDAPTLNPDNVTDIEVAGDREPLSENGRKAFNLIVLGVAVVLFIVIVFIVGLRVRTKI
jgi:hypothetical protein